MVRTAQTLIDAFSGACLESHTQVPLELEPYMHTHIVHIPKESTQHATPLKSDNVYAAKEVKPAMPASLSS